MHDAEFSYIVIEGPIGVGKTTLAKRLAASYDARLVLEAPDDNPFLPRFYENPRANALSTQLYFLLQRVRQLQGLHQGDLFDTCTVADYFLEKDRLFAELTLDADELALYQQVYAQIAGDLPQPDLVIYLQAPVSVLKDRIAQRGLAYETGIDDQYLEQLASAYTRFFYHYEEAPLVVVNAAEIDLANGDDGYEELFEQIQSIKKGRTYLNPLPF